MSWGAPKSDRGSRDRRIPYYLLIRDHFALLIEKGELLPGEKLPPEREVRDRFQTTRVTPRQSPMQL